MTKVLMPCRALEAFRRAGNRNWRSRSRIQVLMPCRALEAFRRLTRASGSGLQSLCLNALSGIGGVQTTYDVIDEIIGVLSLNALSGIGGVQTPPPAGAMAPWPDIVLMPCRALEAFRRDCRSSDRSG